MYNLPSIREQLEAVPTDPGCYIWKNEVGAVLYVGKAKSLRTRMKQYVLGQDERVKIPHMMEQVSIFEYIVCDTETEALVLEKNLIKQYDPPFNTDFRDDKSYPFIAITKGDVFPAVKYTREHHKNETRYFGPYTDSHAARDLVDTVRKIVPICHASCSEHKRILRQYQAHGTLISDKPCFDYHVGLGPGPCCGACTPEEYAKNVEKVERFLAGHRTEFIEALSLQMHDAADDLDFERAARYRDRLASITALQERQKAVSAGNFDADVIGFYREETICGVHVFVIREGRIIISNEFVLDKGLNHPNEEIIETFLLRYYDEASDIPRTVLIPEELPGSEALEEVLTGWRTNSHGAKVRIEVPKRGEKADLLKLAEKNARHTLMRFKVRTRYDEDRINNALLQLESALALPAAPLRIECFDISTIHGKHSVASMVVFSGGRKDTSAYRRFKVRMESEEANDFAMMSEVLARRYAPQRMADERFGSRPDLIIVDGGKPQLTAAMNQLKELGLDIPVAGLAKRDEELFVPWSDEPVVLPSGSPSLYLVKQVRDEAHRFAITFHREVRGKAMTVSILDDVEGLGPKRKKTLLREFGSFKKLKEASLEEIAALPGIPRKVAEEVRAVLDQFEDSR
ncbi:MAG: excinuclease ABC subunit UvrC [Actinobacteria bacterium]|nr:excinuclease ABC subunit UvrC [Actinomycetota bacterium]